ncbi:MAG: LemA family protein [Planctomycetota bacterium]
MPDAWLHALIALGAGLLLGWLLLWLSRRQDRRNWIYRRAPFLPVHSLSEHDDAWVRGRVACDEPLRCPWFDTACVYYDYQIEKKVTRTSTDSKGRTTTTTSWETEYTDSRATPFELVDERDGILVRGERAEFHHLPSTDTDYELGSRRHSATLLPLSEPVSVLGVKLEDESFGPLREVPLLVTTKRREDFLAGGDLSEKLLRWCGFTLLFAGGFVAALLFEKARLQEPEWHVASGIGLATLLPFWFVSTYNRMVRSRQQAEAGWRQIDVDLAVRNSLVPELVQVVKGYQKHESELFRRVGELRAEGADRIRSDAEQSRTVRQLLALVERYPELEANELFMDLHERLWALEEKLAASRTFYNRLAKEWNDLVQSFPSVLVAKLFGYRARPYFSTDHTSFVT